MDPLIHENEQLARYTSWKIGGPARFFADVQTPEQAAWALGWARERELPTFVLGGGTNSLFRDSGFAGLVLRFRASAVSVQQQGEQVVVAIDAGAPTAGTVRKIARQGIGGLEWAEGLPGTIGGAVYGNAGCYGSDTAAVLARAWLLVAGEVEEWPAARFVFGYRTSVLKRTEDRGQSSGSPATMPSHVPYLLAPVVLRAEFVLHQADPLELLRTMAETSELRRGKTPSGQSCGSVFKNPPGDSAGRLIEAVGLKGASIGGAQVAAKHANYIVNQGGATADDVLRLTDLMRERVLAEFGIALELEVQVVG